MALLSVLVAGAPARPGIYEIKGVEVKAEDEDAAKAKLKAIAEAQQKAFTILLGRLLGSRQVGQMPEIPPEEIARVMAGMSVEQERTGPRQYVATLTIRFRPEGVEQILDRYQLSFTSNQAPAVLLLPVYRRGKEAVLWESPNPWRDAWTSLRPENSLTPLLLPLGDLTDADALSAGDAIDNRTEKIALLKQRYNVEHVLVAVAEATDGGNTLAVHMTGTHPIGLIDWRDSFPVASGKIEETARAAAKRFLGAIEDNWRMMAPRQDARRGNSYTIAVPFSGLAEWQTIRRALEQTVGVERIETRSLSGQGAVVDVVYNGPLEQFSAYLERHGLILSESGESLVLYRE